MKKISLILLIIMAVFVTSCEKDKENVVIKGTIDQNTLNNLSPATIVLLMDDADNTFQTFKWTKPDYGYAAVIGYVIQFDKKANNFSSPIDLATVTNDTTVSVKVGDLNKLMLAANMDPEVAVDLQFRVKSTIHIAVNLYIQLLLRQRSLLMPQLSRRYTCAVCHRRMELGSLHL